MATEPTRAPAPQLNSTPAPAPPRRASSPPAPSLRAATMRGGQPAVRLTAGGRAPDADRARAAAEVISVSGAGAPLPAAVQATLEKSFNADLSVVRVHTDARAAGAADSLSARAFTYGNHIVLGSGSNQPTLA